MTKMFKGCECDWFLENGTDCADCREIYEDLGQDRDEILFNELDRELMQLLLGTVPASKEIH